MYNYHINNSYLGDIYIYILAKFYYFGNKMVEMVER
jgi:hypothetical protein